MPETGLPSDGHACVPAGPFPRFVHRNTTIGPVFDLLSKWMWACVAADSSPLKLKVHSISPARLIDARKSPTPGVESAGTSSKPVSASLKLRRPLSAIATAPTPSTQTAVKAAANLILR